MLIARAPVRLSFAGGGTDLPAYYLKHGGAVVSTTLDKYFYVFLNVSGDDTIQITSHDEGDRIADPDVVRDENFSEGNLHFSCSIEDRVGRGLLTESIIDSEHNTATLKI